MLIAAYALLTALRWFAAPHWSVTTGLILIVSVWIALRTVGVGSGRLTTPLGTALAASTMLGTVWSQTFAIPASLVSGPCSPSAIIAVLFGILLIDLCDIPWSRGWTLSRTIRAVTGTIQRVPMRWWGWAFATLFALYLIVIPGVDVLIDRWHPTETSTHVPEDLSFGDAVRLRTMEAMTAVWFFVLGATIGSFLNVVVYRTPRGESLIRRRSACPRCHAPILGRDNVPILGWIWLKGKCRSCQLPISGRYPAIEAIVGGLFLLFYFAELLSGGRNLPERIPNHYAGVVWIIFYTKWDLIGLYLFHCLLLVALLTWWLIRLDGHRVPPRAILTTFTMAIVPLMIWPDLMLISWLPQGPGPWSPSPVDALTTAAVGVMAGLMLGGAVSLLLDGRRGTRPPWSEREFVVGLSLVGAMMGWQAAASVVALTLLVHRLIQRPLGAGSLPSLSRWPLTGSLWIATMLQLLTWRLLATHLAHWWPVTRISTTSFVAWLIIVGAFIALVRRASCPSTLPTNVPDGRGVPRHTDSLLAS